MLDVAQEELTGETLWRATVMPRARNSNVSICRGCKKSSGKKSMGKGHTCLRKHDEKDEKKEKEEGSEVLAEEESRTMRMPA